MTCETTPYVWVGHEYVTIPTSAGTHIVWDSLTNRFNCDSVYKLTLVVKPIPEMEDVDNIVVCTGSRHVHVFDNYRIGQFPLGE